jgi:hypothetical protein
MNDNQANPSRIHIAVVTLLERQLSDWQALRDELTIERAPAGQLAYCTIWIERLQAEVIRIAQEKQL